MSAQLGAIGAQLGLTKPNSRPSSPGGEESVTDSVPLPGAVEEGQGVFASWVRFDLLAISGRAGKTFCGEGYFMDGDRKKKASDHLWFEV